ncbi:MAG: hypothetical protein H6571_21845 [Lewinellaceae bacterium]|nr:hypothetical protein [Lewinellaceae bacterium]
MKLPGYSNISRCEKGQRTPGIELLLVYHLLFDTSVESFFEPQVEIIKTKLSEQIKQLISEIKKRDNIPKDTSIITFLEQVFKRITH